MMLKSDISLVKDDKFLPIVKEYASDNALWLKDFA